MSCRKSRSRLRSGTNWLADRLLVLFFRPFTVLFFASGGFFWWGLVALALALWLTYDYLKRGDMFSQVDAMLSGEGRIFGTYVERRNERDRTGY